MIVGKPVGNDSHMAFAASCAMQMVTWPFVPFTQNLLSWPPKGSLRSVKLLAHGCCVSMSGFLLCLSCEDAHFSL